MRVPDVDAVGDPPVRRQHATRQRALQQRAARRVAVEREALLKHPLRERFRRIRLADAAIRSPRVFIPEQHTAPGRVAITFGHQLPTQRSECPRLHDPRGIRAVHDLLVRGAHGTVFPEAGQVTANARQLRAVTLLHCGEQLRQRGNDQLRTFKARVPLSHDVCQVRVGITVVTADGDTHLYDVPRILPRDEIIHVFAHHVRVSERNTPRRPPTGPRIPSAGRQHHYAISATRSDPPKRLVTPRRQCVPDAITILRWPRHVVWATRQIAYALLRERGHESPREARDIAACCRRDGDAVITTEGARIVKQMDQRFAAGQPRHQIRVRRVEGQVAATHRRQQPRGIGGAALRQIRIERPQPLDIPIEPRTGRIGARAFGKDDRTVHRAPVLVAHLLVHIGIADVEMVVIDEIDLSRHHRQQRHRSERRLRAHAADGCRC